MSLDYSAVPRLPDGRTAAEHIAEVEASARAVRVPMFRNRQGKGGHMMWHVWGEGSGKPILLPLCFFMLQCGPQRGSVHSR